VNIATPSGKFVNVNKNAINAEIGGPPWQFFLKALTPLGILAKTSGTPSPGFLTPCAYMPELHTIIIKKCNNFPYFHAILFLPLAGRVFEVPALGLAFSLHQSVLAAIDIDFCVICSIY
jgi:hypothetical protein